MATTVDCPTCGRKAEYSPANRWRPFCSERCRMIDLGAWASERYAIPGEALDPEDPDTAGERRMGGGDKDNDEARRRH